MKHVIFISQSKLSQNLMTLIVKSMPRKLNFRCFDTIESADRQYSPKTIHLAIIDKNSFLETTKKPFTQKALKNAKIMLIHTRDFHADRQSLKDAGISTLLVKPFLSEELVEMIENQLGYKE